MASRRVASRKRWAKAGFREKVGAAISEAMRKKWAERREQAAKNAPTSDPAKFE
jgi:hypothetical protein